MPSFPSLFGRAALALLTAITLLLPAAGARAADPYEINAILALTGPAGFAGQSEQSALLALEAKVNKAGGIDGRPLKFVIHDDATSAANAIQITNDLIGKKVPLIVGSTLVASCAAMAPLAKDGPVIYCLSNGVHPAAGSFEFSTVQSAADFVSVAIRYARLKGAKRVAAITSTDASGQDGENSFNEALAMPENSGLVVVAREHFSTADITVAAQLARIKAANPDLIFTWTSGTPAGTVFRGLVEAGLDNLPIIASSANATFAQMKQYTTFLPKGLIFGVPAGLLPPDQIGQRNVRAAVQDCIDAMAAQNARPDLLAIVAWDPGLILVDTLKKLGLANATPERIRAYISNIKGFAGAGGVYDFPAIPQRGLNDKQTYVVRWDPAKGAWIGLSKAGGAPL